jgi:hypothetical protein
MLLMNVIDQFFQLDFKHSNYQIWSILRLLFKQQCSLDFRPLGIASECNKRIQTTGPSVDCHGILIILNHGTWTSCERIWQNDLMFDGNNIIVTYSNGILKALIKIYTIFIKAQIIQMGLFNNYISIDNVLLPQSATPKQRNAISVSMLKSITIKFNHCHITMFFLCSNSSTWSSSKFVSTSYTITPLSRMFRCHPSSP